MKPIGYYVDTALEPFYCLEQNCGSYLEEMPYTIKLQMIAATANLLFAREDDDYPFLETVEEFLTFLHSDLQHFFDLNFWEEFFHLPDSSLPVFMEALISLL